MYGKIMHVHASIHKQQKGKQQTGYLFVVCSSIAFKPCFSEQSGWIARMWIGIWVSARRGGSHIIFGGFSMENPSLKGMVNTIVLPSNHPREPQFFQSLKTLKGRRAAGDVGRPSPTLDPTSCASACPWSLGEPRKRCRTCHVQPGWWKCHVYSLRCFSQFGRPWFYSVDFKSFDFSHWFHLFFLFRLSSRIWGESWDQESFLWNNWTSFHA